MFHCHPSTKKVVYVCLTDSYYNNTLFLSIAKILSYIHKNCIEFTFFQDTWYHFKNMVYFKSFTAVHLPPAFLPNIIWQLFMHSVAARTSLGSLLYGQTMYTSCINTNNTVAAQIRIIKDIILQRTKALNIVHLAQFICTRYCFAKMIHPRI